MMKISVFFLVSHLQVKKCPPKQCQLSIFYFCEEHSLLQFIYKQQLLKDKSRRRRKRRCEQRSTVLATRIGKKNAYVETSYRHTQSSVKSTQHSQNDSGFLFFILFQILLIFLYRPETVSSFWVGKSSELMQTYLLRLLHLYMTITKSYFRKHTLILMF